MSAILLCGGEEVVGTHRDPCHHYLHDYPLPDGYTDADIEARRRLSKGWANERCPKCGHYGWRPNGSNYRLPPVKPTIDLPEEEESTTKRKQRE